MDKLKLPTEPYCYDCSEYNLSKIVNVNKNNAGLSTYIDAMVNILEKDKTVHLFLESEVVRVNVLGSTLDKEHSFQVFVNDTSMNTSSIILNLPQQPLLKVLSQSSTLTGIANQTALKALHYVKGGPGLKLYVLYENAWWRNELNLTVGRFNNSAIPENYTSGTAVPEFPPLSGRYHDGHIICDPICRGFLEAAYAYDDISLSYYQSYIHDTMPYTVLNYHDNWEARILLDSIHKEMIRINLAALLKIPGALNRVRALRPSLAVLAVWDRNTDGFGAGIHDWMRDSRPESVCSSYSQCQRVMPKIAIAPLGPNIPIYVANEAFGSRMGWCEGALAMAENVLHYFFGLSQPSWISSKNYKQWVLYNITTD